MEAAEDSAETGTNAGALAERAELEAPAEEEAGGCEEAESAPDHSYTTGLQHPSDRNKARGRRSHKQIKRCIPVVLRPVLAPVPVHARVGRCQCQGRSRDGHGRARAKKRGWRRRRKQRKKHQKMQWIEKKIGIAKKKPWINS